MAPSKAQVILSHFGSPVAASTKTAVVYFEVARASCPCAVMAKMAMPPQTEPLPEHAQGLTPRSHSSNLAGKREFGDFSLCQRETFPKKENPCVNRP